MGLGGVDCVSYVGLITRLMPSSVSLESAEVHMVTECDREFHVGEYLVVESRGSNYLARIAESRVEDIYSIAKTPVLSLDQELAMDVKYVPRLIKLELISECRNSDCGPPTKPPEIHSRVRVPGPGEVSRMLSLPSAGVVIGALALPNGSSLPDNQVLLPLDALRHHVLVVGTTGSGKTTLLKNLALELVGNYGKVTVVSLDAVGHYHHLLLNNVDVRVLMPVTRGMLRRYLGSGGDVKDLAHALVRDYVNSAFKSFGIRLGRARVRARFARRRKGGVSVVREVRVMPGNLRAGVTIIPWALRTRAILYRVNDVTGMLTEQARMFYGRVIKAVRDKVPGELTFRKIYNHLISPSEVQERGRRLLNYEVIARDLGIHESTLQNIIRTILAIIETGVVDVKRGNVVVPEPDYREVLRPGYVVLHLANVLPMAQRVMVYRVLDVVYRFMGPEHLRDRERMSAVLVDEAHLFFPQTRSEDEKAMLERHLTRLTRLGRGRGIAVVFATHMPTDLNDAVIQLTNTKIVLRSDEKVLERLGIPSSERRFLTTATAGLAYVTTFAYRYPVYVRITPRAYHVG